MILLRPLKDLRMRSIWAYFSTSYPHINYVRKYAQSEGTKVLSPDAHKSAQEALHKQGKTTASGLNDADREKFDESLRQAE